MMVGAPPPYQMPMQCVCGAPDPSQCACGAMTPLQPTHPNQRIPYPAMPVPADQYSYDHQVPTTSECSGPMQNPAMNQHQSQQQHQQLQQQQMYHEYMQQQNRSCQQQPSAPIHAHSAYNSRPPSRIQPPHPPPPSAHTTHWMNNHYMNPSGYAHSPAPSAAASVMSIPMSHMSVQDDHLSVMSLQSMYDGATQPQYTELRPASQISTASGVENVDPRLQPVAMDQPWSLDQLLQCYFDPRFRHHVISQTVSFARHVKERKTEGSPRLLKASFQLAKQMCGEREQMRMANHGHVDETLDKLISTHFGSIFYQILGMSSEAVFGVFQQTQGDVMSVLISNATHKPCMISIVHILEWKQKASDPNLPDRPCPCAEKVKRWLKEHQLEQRLLDSFMEVLTITHDHTLFDSYQYALDGIREMINCKEDLKEYVLSRWSRCLSVGGLVEILFQFSFVFCDNMQRLENQPPRTNKTIITTLHKIMKLLKALVFHRGGFNLNVEVLNRMIRQDGMLRFASYMCAHDTRLYTSAMEQLINLNCGSKELIDMTSEHAVTKITEQMMLMLRGNCSKWSPTEVLRWERGFAFLTNFVANRELNKRILICYDGFNAIASSIWNFSYLLAHSEHSKIRWGKLNEFLDNAELCLCSLVTYKEPDVFPRRDAALGQNLLIGLLNCLCQAEFYVRRRTLRVLELLIEYVPAFRSSELLQKVFDAKRKQNLMSCLYDIIATASSRSKQLDQSKTSGLDSEGRRIDPELLSRIPQRLELLPDLIIRSFKLLTCILRQCDSKPKEDIRFLVRNNPNPPLELLRLFDVNDTLRSSILEFCIEVISGGDTLQIQQAWGAQQQMLDLLSNSSQPAIAQHAQTLVSRLFSSTLGNAMCVADDYSYGM